MVSVVTASESGLNQNNQWLTALSGGENNSKVADPNPATSESTSTS
jgi:hypothetical protein